jgi:hypothetical protein
VWNLYAQARRWRSRPSALLGLTDAYEAFCLDEAIGDLASYIEQELEKVKVKGDKPELLEKRRQAVLESLLTGQVAKRFADPMAKAKT